MIKKPSRVLLWIIGALIGLPVLFAILLFTTIVAVNFYDPPVNPEITALETTNPIPRDSDNAYIFYHGLDAPEGEDPVNYALTRPLAPDEGFVSYSSMNELQAAAKEQEKQLPLTPEQALAKKLANDRTAFSDDTIRLRCILGQVSKKYTMEADDAPPCATLAEAEQILDKHKILLERYLSLSRFPRSTYVFKQRELSSVDLSFGTIEIHSMSLVSMLLKAQQGRQKEALDDWIESTKYLNTVLSDQNNMVTHAIAFVKYGMNLRALPVIVNANNALATEYAPALTTLLSRPAFGENGVDLYKVFLAERRFIEENMKFNQERNEAVTDGIFLGRHFYKENDMFNKIYAYYKDFKYVVEAAQDPDLDLSVEEFELQLHDPMMRQSVMDIIYNPVGNMLLGGQMKGMELYGYQIRKQTTDMHMLGAYILALAQNIPPDAMPAFLSNLPDPWKSAFTLTPFLWDEKTASIYYERTVKEERPLTDEENAAITRAVINGTEYHEFPEAVDTLKRFGVSMNKDTQPSFQ